MLLVQTGCNGSLDGGDGTDPDGCVFDRDCADDEYCEGRWGTPTHCEPFLQLGAPCSGGGVCGDGLLCRDDLPVPRCLAPGEWGAICGEDWGCAPGLSCLETRYPPECGAPAVEGALCQHWDGYGAEGCVGSTCNYGYRPPICAPPCAHGQPCWTDHHWSTDLICNEAFVPPTCLSPGEPGSFCREDLDCEDGLLCNAAFNPPVCSLPNRAGGACHSDADCGDGLICDRWAEPRVCAAPKGLGEKCNGDGSLWAVCEVCGPGLTCAFDLEPPVCLESEQCFVDEDCLGGETCLMGWSLWGDCGPPGTYGTPCEGDQDCAVGYHCSTSSVPHCITTKLSGEECNSNGQCAGALECVGQVCVEG